MIILYILLGALPWFLIGAWSITRLAEAYLGQTTLGTKVSRRVFALGSIGGGLTLLVYLLSMLIGMVIILYQMLKKG